jgi:hypothetical protein
MMDCCNLAYDGLVFNGLLLKGGAFKNQKK